MDSPRAVSLVDAIVRPIIITEGNVAVKTIVNSKTFQIEMSVDKLDVD